MFCTTPALSSCQQGERMHAGNFENPNAGNLNINLNEAEEHIRDAVLAPVAPTNVNCPELNIPDFEVQNEHVRNPQIFIWLP